MADKTDWSRVEEARKKAQGGANPNQLPVVTRPPTPLEAQHSNAPSALAVDTLSTNEPQGILGRWKKNTISRRATLQALQAHYDAELDKFEHRLKQQVRVEKDRVDTFAKEYLAKLDLEHLKVIRELDVENADTRGEVMHTLNDKITARLREAKSADWPPELIDETINNLFALQKRAMAKIMAEVGQQEK